MVVPDVGVLVKSDRILTTSKGVKTKVPVIIGCNVFKHAARKFIQDYGETALELFECPKEIDPLFFSCMELYYFSERDCKTTTPSSEEREANGKRGVGQLTWQAPKLETSLPLGQTYHKGKAEKNQNPTSRLKKTPKMTVGT